MLENNQGRIINISSVSGLISLPLIGVYSASKYALESITDALKMELWKTNIKVITINPGLVNTDINTVSKPKLNSLSKRSHHPGFQKYIGNMSIMYLKDYLRILLQILS
jgi:short-subunit dehydrogenase